MVLNIFWNTRVASVGGSFPARPSCEVPPALCLHSAPGLYAYVQSLLTETPWWVRDSGLNKLAASLTYFTKISFYESFLLFIYLFIYLFLAVLGLRFCARAFSSCGEWRPLFIAARGPLTIAASPVAEHRLQTRRLSSCGSRTQLLRGMWDLPKPGPEIASPALAGGFSTPAPPGKPSMNLFKRVVMVAKFYEYTKNQELCTLKEYVSQCWNKFLGPRWSHSCLGCHDSTKT